MAKEEKEVKAKSTYMTAFAELSVRAIAERVNREEIKKESIVSLLKEGGQYVLVYYK